MKVDISIIVPTYNRAVALHRTLTSIGKVVRSNDPVEVIIVDNGSGDNTAAVCRDIENRFPKHNFCYFYDEMPGLLTGRHLGARKAKGEILSFLDDDVVLAPSWLAALKDAFSDPEVMLAGGPSWPQYEVEPPHWLSGMWDEFEGGRVCGELSLVDQGATAKEANPLYIGGLNFSIKKTALQMCGGFHPDYLPSSLQRYQGDGETGLAFKLQDRGLKALYLPELALNHVIPSSRLTAEYFEWRGFYQGVCNSYSSIRRNGYAPARSKSWKDLARPIKWKLERERILRNATAAGVRFLVARARFAGQWFHEDEVRKDPKLLDWVVKSDYFNYALPDGWEKYMRGASKKNKKKFTALRSK
jgi:glycosyltransferase involved in cell wall biosynthesis